MRVLFSSIPGVSHLFALVPLAWGFRAAGHEVIVAFGEEYLDKATRTGLEVVNVAPGYAGMALIEQTLAEDPELAQKFWSEALSDDPTPWAKLFAAINRPLVERTMDLVDAWRPDLVVYEQASTAGLLAAARAGVPAVQRNMGIVRTGLMHEATVEHLQDLMERYGIKEVPKPARVLEYVPPSMLPHDEPEGWFMREVPYTGGGVLGERLPEPGDRPRVVITMGTVRPGSDFYGLEPVKRLITAAASVDAEFLLALGDVDASPLGELPPNVTSIGWAPLAALFRTCAGVVHHGGGGTTMAAIEAGIPQLLALDPLDQGNETTGPAVRKGGIGIVTTLEEVESSMMERLITDETLRKRTLDVRAELATLPSPAETASRLLDELT
ncbi:MAG TPA: nucleotide disphospho-sugar-binding domain-containing protein [Micromonosporaceae bacterium]|nr:nucleotide disphospho-sugar-binding domain-containing protein [Micromonosporaceae bacterium]